MQELPRGESYCDRRESTFQVSEVPFHNIPLHVMTPYFSGQKKCQNSPKRKTPVWTDLNNTINNSHENQ